FTVTAGTIPDGLTFSAVVNELDITGTPTTAGSVSFDVTAADAFGNQTTQSYTLVINPAVSLSPAAVAPGTVGTASFQAITAAGGTGDKALTFTVTAGSIPDGLTFTAIANELDITGTPTVDGSVSFDVTATDAVGATVTQSYTLTINAAA